MPDHATFYFRRELVEKFGGYDLQFYTAADFEFMTRYLYLLKISSFYLPKLIVKMRAGGASNESILARIKANHRDYLAMKKNKIPLPFVVSILKPLIKIPQFYKVVLYKFLKPFNFNKTIKLSSFPD